MGRNKNKKMWNRKRKLESAEERSNQDRKPYVTVPPSNPKMEAYYAAVGLHSLRREGSDFVPCVDDIEKEQERNSFITCLRTTLPASFRIGQNLEPEFRQKLKRDIDIFVGTEIEIEIDQDGNAVCKPRLGMDSKDATEDGTATGTAEEEAKDTKSDQIIGPSEPVKIKKLAPAKPIPYIPDAYQLSVDKKTIRRNPLLQEFHEWLKVQTDSGFITRQETVSMIPPVVLSPESHHAVLDMCAAPGSKTSQLLEIISNIPQGETEPTGYVVANDSDAKRAYMLVHQLRRLNSPATFVTAKDAQFWPMLLRGKNIKDEERAQEGIFDRVLCDVPCTGDGTARKNPGIWKHWTASAGHSIHPLQLSIALNGARLTKVGGYMCYSTCSMNPIENEAVVAEILRTTDGSLKLVDKRPDMPGIVARPGWSNWKVLGESLSKKQLRNKAKKNSAKMKKRRKDWEDRQKLENGEKNDQMELDENGVAEQVEEENGEKNDDLQENVTDVEDECESEQQSWDEEVLVQRAVDQGLVEYKTFDDVPKDSTHHIRKSCFPPTPEEAAEFKFERCLRVLPHDLDTGGFFVALFKKVCPLSNRARRKAEELAESVSKRMDTPTNEAIKNDDSENVSDDGVTVGMELEDIARDTEVGKKQSLKKRDSCDIDKAESFVAVDEDVLPPLIDFYGFTDQFAKGQFMARAGGQSKLLYFITKSVKQNLIDRGIQDRIHVINSGLRAFERRNKDDCLVNYRPCQESIHFVGPHMTKRKFIVSSEDFKRCLKYGAIPCDSFSEPLCSQMKALSLGAFVVALVGYEDDITKKMYLVMWKCRGDNINCLVNKLDMVAFHNKLDVLAEKECGGSNDSLARGAVATIREKCSIQ